MGYNAEIAHWSKAMGCSLYSPGKICSMVIIGVIACCVGCESLRRQELFSKRLATPSPPSGERSVADRPLKPIVHQVSHHQEESPSDPSPTLSTNAEASADTAAEALAHLEAAAIATNPTLRRMQQEAAGEWAKTGYVAKLPDPSIGTMFYTPPMNFVPDRQLAEVQVTQMIPWLSRLNAEAQRAHLEALSAENLYQAERLRVIGDLRVTWFKLYVLGKQIQTIEADKSQLESLIKTANARVAAGDAQSGDVLMGMLELSSLQEQLLSFRQQSVAAKAEINRLVGRDSQFSLEPPTTIEPKLPDWNHSLLRQIAMEKQPELNAARMRTAATRWGVEVARLKRRPDLTFGVGWVIMDAPGATMPGDGADSFTLGVTASVPIWRRKYDAMTAEASRGHYAAHASEDEIALRLDSMLSDLWEQALTTQRTVELYEKSILPQARQTFEADQKSLVNNAVTFDRVIRNYRSLLNLENGYHRALGQLATTLARIRQTVGVDLLDSEEFAQP